MVLVVLEMPPVLVGYIAFFVVSFLVLALIGIVALPGVCRKVRRQVRLAVARRRRGVRMLADPERLESGARMLEGICLFGEEPDAGEAFYAEAESATGSGRA